MSAKRRTRAIDFANIDSPVPLATLRALDERLRIFQGALYQRINESDKLICSATEVLRTVATNMREARDQSRILDARVTARLDALGTAINKLGELLEGNRRGCLSVVEVLELVDEARKRSP
jgi:hypothetical protein